MTSPSPSRTRWPYYLAVVIVLSGTVLMVSKPCNDVEPKPNPTPSQP